MTSPLCAGRSRVLHMRHGILFENAPYGNRPQRERHGVATVWPLSPGLYPCLTAELVSTGNYKQHPNDGREMVALINVISFYVGSDKGSGNVSLIRKRGVRGPYPMAAIRSVGTAARSDREALGSAARSDRKPPGQPLVPTESPRVSHSTVPMDVR